MTSQRTYAVLGAEFNLPKVKVPKKKHAPIMTEARDKAVAEALHPDDLDEIHAAAVAYAAEKIREFERRTGR